MITTGSGPRLSLLFAAALCALPACAAAADQTKQVELKKAFPYLDAYDALRPEERSRFRLVYRFKITGVPLSQVHIAYLVGGQRTAVALEGDGQPAYLPAAAQLSSGKLELGGPEQAKVRIEMEVSPNERPAAEMDAHALVASLQQAAVAVHKAAGVFGFAAPKMERVTFRDAAGGEMVSAAGKVTPLQVVAGAPVLDPAKAPDARQVRFSRAPASIYFGPAK